MITAKRFEIDDDPVDLAAGSGMSGVKIYAIQNVGQVPVWVGDVGEGWEIKPGETVTAGIELASQEALDLNIDSDDGDDQGLVQVLMRHA